MDATIAKRRELERRIVRGLIRHLKTFGWVASYVDDGGDDLVPIATEREAMDAVFAVDDSRLGFARRDAEHPIRGSHRVLLIGGNGEDIISDWSYAPGDPDGFSAAMDVYLDRVEEIAREAGR